MKKYNILLVLLVSLVFITGCFNETIQAEDEKEKKNDTPSITEMEDYLENKKKE